MKITKLAEDAAGNAELFELIADDGSIYNASLGRIFMLPTVSRWYLSVSGHDGLTPWPILSEIAYLLKPDIKFVIGVPSPNYWDDAPNVIHMWEMDDKILNDQLTTIFRLKSVD